MPKRCNPPGNHGCGKMKSLSEFKTERNGYRKLCSACAKKYNEKHRKRKEAARLARMATGPKRDTADYLFLCGTKPTKQQDLTHDNDTPQTYQHR